MYLRWILGDSVDVCFWARRWRVSRERQERRSRGARGSEVRRLSGACMSSALEAARYIHGARPIIFPRAAFYRARWSAQNGPRALNRRFLPHAGTYPALVGDALTFAPSILLRAAAEVDEQDAWIGCMTSSRDGEQHHVDRQRTVRVGSEQRVKLTGKEL